MQAHGVPKRYLLPAVRCPDCKRAPALRIPEAERNAAQGQPPSSEKASYRCKCGTTYTITAGAYMGAA